MTLKDEIAITAARLVVGEGMEYAAAKRRAARGLSQRCTRRGELPSNEEVEDQVREHIDLFCADTQPAELRALREVALLWMERLAEFRPHLGGAVWRGTATRLSAVHLDLYCDDTKAAELALVNAGVDYDVGSIERAGAEPVNVLTVGTLSAALGGMSSGRSAGTSGLTSGFTGSSNLVSVHLILRDLDDQRGALKPDARGRSWRGDAKALKTLMQAEATA